MMTTTSARRAGAVLTLGFAAVMLLAGCASAPEANAPSGDSGSSAELSANAYAACMRDNGVPGFPDPGANGEFSIDGNTLGVDIESEQYAQAEETCDPLMPKQSEAQQQADYSARLAYAACMRENGLPGFPDPQPPADGPTTSKDSSGGSNAGGLGFDPDSAQFRTAHEACEHLLPEGDSGPSTSTMP
jgi:hypothetical protein